jgi:hypothetical protein
MHNHGTPHREFYLHRAFRTGEIFRLLSGKRRKFGGKAGKALAWDAPGEGIGKSGENEGISGPIILTSPASGNLFLESHDACEIPLNIEG